MENNEVKTAAAAEAGTEEKTFTQSQVDKIVGRRVYEEGAKYADYEELKAKAAKVDALEAEAAKAKGLESQLDALKREKEVNTVRAEVAELKGIPAKLLHGATKEECEAEADALLEFRGNPYPRVTDAGEAKHGAGGSTAQQFAEWFKSQIGR